MVFPVVLRGRPGTSARNHPHGTSTSKPVVPVGMCFKVSFGSAARLPETRRAVASGSVELRTLGHTGTKVSPLCLGAMMFGAWGETDHDDSVRIIHAALDAGINFVDTADVYSRGE